MGGILAKAKDIVDKNWVTGQYLEFIRPNGNVQGWIVIDDYEEHPELAGNPIEGLTTCIPVDPDTVCYHTGHPNNIYGGDLVKSWYGTYGTCRWNEGECQWVIEAELFENLPIPLHKNDDWKPTGKNIHD